MKVKVNEIFLSWQGEGVKTGMPAVFIRLSGCNLSCGFCDTDHEFGEAHSCEDVMRKVEVVIGSCAIDNVVITGGEPLLQNGFDELVQLLWLENFNIFIETNGTLWQKGLTYAWVTCSPKAGTEVNPKVEKRINEYKYIIQSDSVIDLRDGLPEGLPRPKVFNYGNKISVQPCDYGDVERNGEALEKAKQVSHKYGYDLSIQVHKLINVK